mmetsp:Transcript_27708/g.39635  ORF Transcript_27708/g.39635 Transcript_27708/m.39635 type:complete len:259 (+) Transcript_27708:164-940(+)
MKLIESSDLFLLVVAHPDDECMFFFPTIVHLASATGGIPFYILCMSNGNYNGLGRQREKEFIKAALVLCIDASNVNIIDDPLLQDNPHVDWDEELVSDRIFRHVQLLLAENGQDKQTNVTIITFDKYGISGHRNHISIYRGVQHLVRNDRRKFQFGGIISMRAICLLSVSSVFQKYVPFVYFMEILWHYRNAKSDTVYHLTSINLVLAWRALSTHQSQFVWYRKLSILFSRYTYFNQLVEIKTTSLLGTQRNKEMMQN